MDQNITNVPTEPTLPNSKLPLILLIIVISLASGAAGFYLSQTLSLSTPPTPRETISTPTQPTPPESSTPAPTTTDETANWKIYSNPLEGYSVQYPKDIFIRWVCPEEQLGLTLRSTANVNEEEISQYTCGRGARFDIEITTNPSLKTLEFIERNYSFSSEKIKIGGVDGIKYTATLKDGVNGELPDWFKEITIKKDGKVYDLYLGTKKFETTFDQILSTFRFLD